MARCGGFCIDEAKVKELGKALDSEEARDTQLEIEQGQNLQIPANLVAAEFGEVNVRRLTDGEVHQCHVEFTIAMEPQGRFAEGWRTGLALDASASMKRAYGRKVEARVDPELLTSYIKQGRLQSFMQDGEPIRKIQRDAFIEMQEQGYEVNYTENILQPLVQDFTAYLAGNIDGTGKTSLIYWGCGQGHEVEALGDFDAADCQKLAIAGPATFRLGKTTKLLPAIAYFTKNPQYNQAQRGIYIFLTDGRIDDLEQVKIYTKELALEIAVGKRNYLKLILIGIGKDVDRYQLQELDDFDTGLEIDIWDYKIASEMNNLTQIFAEVVNENQIIAESGSIYDDQGNCVKSYANGLPAKVDFLMRGDSQWFELEVGTQRIQQLVVLENHEAIAPLAKKSLLEFEILARENQQQAIASTTDVVIAPESDHSLLQNKWYRFLAMLLLGAAFIGTAIAFAILIQRSDRDRLPANVKPAAIGKADPNFVLVKKAPPKSPSQLESKPNPQSSKSSSSNSSTSSTNPSRDSSNSSQTNIQTNTQTNTQTNSQGNSQGNSQSNSRLSSGIAEENSPRKNLSNSQTNSNQNNTTNPNSATPPNPVNTPTPAITPSTNLSINKSTNKSSSPTANNSILPIVNPDLETTIFFPSDQVQLTPQEEAKIDAFWAKIQGKRGVLQVRGHADQTGDYDYNLEISQARATEVVKLLRDRGLDNNYKVTFEALSWLQPIRKSTTAADNALNRRVVIQFKELR